MKEHRVKVGVHTLHIDHDDGFPKPLSLCAFHYFASTFTNPHDRVNWSDCIVKTNVPI